MRLPSLDGGVFTLGNLDPQPVRGLASLIERERIQPADRVHPATPSRATKGVFSGGPETQDQTSASGVSDIDIPPLALSRFIRRSVSMPSRFALLVHSQIL